MCRKSVTAHSVAVRNEVAEFALYFLMSRFAVQPSYWITQAIIHHLEILSERAGSEGDVQKKSHYMGLIPTWDFIASKFDSPTTLNAGSAPAVKISGLVQ